MSRLLFMMGPGGVGKTTLSVLHGFYYARHQKWKTLVLSIDPSKRLASELNLDLTGNIRTIETNLDAAILDQKTIFDQMLEKLIPDHKIRSRLQNNPLYEASSQHFGGAVEYMALVKMEQNLQNYDLIIVDTPPDLHAIDFLSRPEILAQFFEHKIFSWLIKPAYFAAKLGIMRIGNQAFAALTKIVGSKALGDLIDFLYHMMPFIEGFHDIAEKMRVHFHSPLTRYMIIHRPDWPSYKSALALNQALSNIGLKANALVQNQAMAIPTGKENFHPKDLEFFHQILETQKSIEDHWKSHQSTPTNISPGAPFHRIETWSPIPLGNINHAEMVLDIML